MYRRFSGRSIRPHAGKQRKRRVFGVLLLGLFLFAFCEKKISPMAGSLAMNAAKETAIKRVSAVVAANVPQSPFAGAEKDSGGCYTGMTLDAMAISVWKAELCTQMDKALQKKVTAKVPFGSLLPVKLLAGHGPKIALRVPVQTVLQVSVRSAFSSAGINQTLHKVTLLVQVSLCPYADWMPEMETLILEFPLSECILLGQVPARVGTY